MYDIENYATDMGEVISLHVSHRMAEDLREWAHEHGGGLHDLIRMVLQDVIAT